MTSKNTRPKTGYYRSNQTARDKPTFEEWQTAQAADVRTPEQRGIGVGSSVMWRRRNGNVIVTERAIVVAIAESTLTLLVKDVEARTCQAHVREIVSTPAEHMQGKALL